MKERGHSVIAVTSLEHSRRLPSRHPSGASIGGTSSLTSVLIAQLLVAEVCGRLLQLGQDVPVLISANVPGTDGHNDSVMARYKGRIRLGEP